jgi:hypothetical protein
MSRADTPLSAHDTDEPPSDLEAWVSERTANCLEPFRRIPPLAWFLLLSAASMKGGDP